MTTRQIIEGLIKQGHKVKFYQRKDGGVRITKIDSQSFSGSMGNKVARAMTGEYLSERRSAQLSKSYMKTEKGKWGHAKSKKPPLPDEAKKLIRKAQRVFRKSGTIAGTSSTRRFRENVELFGYDEAMRRLKQNIRYAQGLAYEENVEHLKRLLEDYGNKADLTDSQKVQLQRILNELDTKISKFKDVWIKQIREILYNRKNGLISNQNMLDDIEEVMNS